jgi:hypothetical protein
MSALTALQQALRLRDQPERLGDLQRAPLPPDMDGLIRIASGEAAATGAEQSAAAAFLEQVCLHAGADPRRCLALQAHDDLITARTHHRLLIKWLHPDRNPGAQLLAERVNSAWTALKNPLPAAPAEALLRPAAPVPRTRFPLFLGLLLLAAVALLAVSLLPVAPVYVDTAGRAEAPARPAQASDLAQSLAALPLAADVPAAPAKPSLPKSAAVPAAKPAAKPIAQTVPENPRAAAIAQARPAPVRQPTPPAPRMESVPVPVPKPIAVSAAVADALSAAEAEALLQQYQTHYSAGNLSGLMALFSPKAISLKGGVESIAAEHSRLFSSTRQRRIALSNPRWQQVDDARRLRAGFQSELAFGAMRAPQRRSGSLEMLMVRENGKPRILELLITD